MFGYEGLKGVCLMGTQVVPPGILTLMQETALGPSPPPLGFRIKHDTTMPEKDTVRCFLEELLKHIHDFDSPDGPTVLKGIFFPDKENVKGDPFPTDPNDTEAIERMSLLIRNAMDVERLPESLKGRRIHSVQQIGTVLEILLLRDDFDPAAKTEQTVDAMRIIFKNQAQIGWLKISDWEKYPAAYTCRERRGPGLGSGYKVDTLLGWGGKALTGPEFSGPLARAVNQVWCILVQVLDSEYGFDGIGARIKGHLCGILRAAQRDVCQVRERRNGRYWDFMRRMAKLLGITRLQDLQHPENLHLLPIFLAVVYQFLLDSRFQDKDYNVMTANIGKKAAASASYVVAYQQPDHVLNGRPENDPGNVHLKAHVHVDVIASDPQEWREIQSEMGIRKLGEPLKKPGLTRGRLGAMAHGFVSCGENGDLQLYDSQSVPGPKQQRVRQPEYGADGKRVDRPYDIHGGKNDKRKRDIGDGLYALAESDGSRGPGRQMYECCMSYLGFSEEDLLPGKRVELNAKRKAERPGPEELAAAAQERKRAKRQRLKEQKKGRVGSAGGETPCERTAPHSSPVLWDDDMEVSKGRLRFPFVPPLGAFMYEAGRVVRYTRWNGQHQILYDNGIRKFVNLTKDRWHVLDDDDSLEGGGAAGDKTGDHDEEGCVLAPRRAPTGSRRKPSKALAMP
ncbi:hypothetical protein KFL_008630060 [Klebsormidium nitens]|uniref:Uncharacterized protein n=1 Tax=Klebsormidium nitens TaxID=105231 RepID=A0A1Y1IUD8_KLENI|nr:hypothetical protein KFL_008630060 [Klebsormidium nitens]|eukprot:GAQ91828.1 hypothetical protein KFL_008630060 [Klebsormidium nitens]